MNQPSDPAQPEPEDRRPSRGTDGRRPRGGPAASRGDRAGAGRPPQDGRGAERASGGRAGSARSATTGGRQSGTGRAASAGRPGFEGRPGTGAPRGGAGRRGEIEKRTYDPRREERRKAARVPLPDDVDARMLDAEVRTELRPLVRETADTVARHLVMTGRLIDDDPEQALAHARAARALAGRVGSVREAAGLAAYRAGEWSEALAELRAARRITGSASHLAVMADCERALGRPERALAVGDDPSVTALEQTERVELVIVLAGARRDLGQVDAAVLQLQEPARRTKRSRPWAARLWYAYADMLLAAGREHEAREWFSSAADADEQGETDADERLLELDGVVLEDLHDGEADEVASEQAPADDAEGAGRA